MHVRGGRSPIKQGFIDFQIEACKEMILGKGVTKPPRWDQIAIQDAYELLVNWGHDPTNSRLSLWHRVATALLGIDNKSVDLRRQMGAFLRLKKDPDADPIEVAFWPFPSAKVACKRQK